MKSSVSALFCEAVYCEVINYCIILDCSCVFCVYLYMGRDVYLYISFTQDTYVLMFKLLNYTVHMVALTCLYMCFQEPYLFLIVFYIYFIP